MSLETMIRGLSRDEKLAPVFVPTQCFACFRVIENRSSLP